MVENAGAAAEGERRLHEPHADDPRYETYVELVDWWGEVWRQEEGRRAWAALVATPDGWGVDAVLDPLRSKVEGDWDDRPARALVIEPPPDLGGIGVQTTWLRPRGALGAVRR